MANTKLSGLTAASATADADLFYTSQGATSKKATALQLKTYCSASPTLVTPVLGVASGTSLALAGDLTISGAGAIAQSSAATNILNGGLAVGGAALTIATAYIARSGSQILTVVAGGVMCWAPSTNPNASTDTALSRISAGIVGVGSGAVADVTGTLRAAALAAGGSDFTITAANSVSPTLPNRTITISYGGTTYYLAAKTTNN